eukprot:GHVR01162505.1.p1 GENE.GHVR01162505.1~~GHVR01162505.1.p1  ORF type:complete len:222 (-),score=47.54 GHVR01162505.1:594-1259(-)
MTSYSESFIPGAMNKLCAGKTNSHFTNLANYIAGFTNDSTPIDVALAKAVFECQAAEQEAPFHTFAVLGFFQTIMDRVMWNARKLRIAMDRAEQQQQESGGIYGVDLAQSAIDDVEVNIDFNRIKDAVQSDYELLFTTQTLIMSELAIDGEQFGIDLLFFNPSNLDETSGQWVQDTPADTYDDAMRVMQEIVDDLKAADNKTLMAGYLKNREAVLAARLAA